MFNKIVFIYFYIVCIKVCASVDVNITAYAECQTDLPAQDIGDTSQLNVVVIWLKNTTIILRYLNTTGALIYENGFDEAKYSVNRQTVGLIIHDIEQSDEGLYTLDKGDLFEVYLTVNSLTSSALERVISVNFNNSRNIPNGVTEDVMIGDTIRIIASANELNSGDSVELDWGNSTGPYTTDGTSTWVIIPDTTEAGTFSYTVKSSACGVTSDPYTIYITVAEFTTTIASTTIDEPIVVCDTWQALYWVALILTIAVCSCTIPLAISTVDKGCWTFKVKAVVCIVLAICSVILPFAATITFIVLYVDCDDVENLIHLVISAIITVVSIAVLIIVICLIVKTRNKAASQVINNKQQSKDDKQSTDNDNRAG